MSKKVELLKVKLDYEGYQNSQISYINITLFILFFSLLFIPSSFSGFLKFYRIYILVGLAIAFMGGMKVLMDSGIRHKEYYEKLLKLLGDKNVS